MNLKLFLAILLFALGTLFSNGTEVEGRILNYGIFQKDMPSRITKTPETTSGVTKVASGQQEIISITNRVPAKIGVCFGMTYELSNLTATNGTLIDVVKIVTHPPITKPDGTVVRGFTFVEKAIVENGRATNWTGYGFDHEYELAPGLWQFEMKYDGKTMVKQDFTVYKE